MRFVLSIILMAGLAAPASAVTAQTSLETTLEELKASRKQEHELADKVARVGSELANLQQQSDTLVNSVRTLQTAIRDNETEQDQLMRELSAREADFASRREEVAKLLHGMIRLQRMPRHFVLATPSNSRDLLRTASALDVTYQATHTELNEVQSAVTEITRLGKELETAKEELSEQVAELQDTQSELRQNVAKRRELQRSLQANHADVKARVLALSSQSRSLRELIGRLESETLLFKEVGMPRLKPKAPSREAILFAGRKGNLPYPAPGRFLHRFGERQGPEERYQGVIIQTAPNAPVTAPHRGKVVFSGNFMDYGPMVIVQHDDTYHSVIAGLDVIEVEPGQPVRGDELLGVMGNTPENRKLYFELRKHSKAIDPTAWMGNLRRVASR